MPPTTKLDEGLASLFGVEIWSTEFYQVIFTISSRIDELIAITDILTLDDDHKEEMVQGLKTIKMAFGPNGLQNTFQHSQHCYLSPATISPLSALSGLVRPIRLYPKLNENEKENLIGEIDILLDWLDKHQLSEQDFIRQALIEGLVNVRFRLQRIQWLGWGFTLRGLQEVITAYFALERGIPQNSENPPAEATLKILNKFLKNFLEKAGIAKNTIETIEFMLKAYGFIQLTLAGKISIAGLLTHGG